MEIISVKTFKEELVVDFQTNPKTSWGKNELMLHIIEFYTKFLEKELTK